jgi:regulatory protein
MMPHRQKSKKTALVQAVDLLARQEHSIHKLKEKLEQRGYGAEEIEAAIVRLQERHYLDDEAVCNRQFRYFYEESRLSVRQICAKLMQRGFDSTLVKSCVPQDSFERERQAALRCLHIKFKPEADREKMLQHLYGRGFDSHAIRAAVEEFLVENEGQA